MFCVHSTADVFALPWDIERLKTFWVLGDHVDCVGEEQVSADGVLSPTCDDFVVSALEQFVYLDGDGDMNLVGRLA